MRLNWLAKIWIGEARAPWLSILILLLHAKMLKNTETEETIGLVVTLLSLMVFQLVGGARAHLATPMEGRVH